MREVNITSRQFEVFAWPALATQPLDNGGEVDAHVRLLKKFKGASTMLGEGEEGVSARTLDKPVHTFSLEEDEWGRLKKVIQSWLLKIAGGAMDEFKDFQDTVTGADSLET